MVLATLWKVNWPYECKFLSGLSVLFHCPVSVLRPEPHCFKNYRLVVSYKARECESSDFILLFHWGMCDHHHHCRHHALCHHHYPFSQRVNRCAPLGWICCGKLSKWTCAHPGMDMQMTDVRVRMDQTAIVCDCTQTGHWWRDDMWPLKNAKLGAKGLYRVTHILGCHLRINVNIFIFGVFYDTKMTPKYMTPKIHN